MPFPSPLGEAVKAALDALPGVAEHPAGHSQNLLRYRAPTGASFAVQRVETTAVRFWAGEDESFRAAVTALGLPCTSSDVPSKGRSGRNSNLDQIPEFRRRTLLWIPVRDAGQAAAVYGLLVAATARGDAPDSATPLVADGAVTETQALEAQAAEEPSVPSRDLPVEPSPSMAPARETPVPGDASPASASSAPQGSAPARRGLLARIASALLRRLPGHR